MKTCTARLVSISPYSTSFKHNTEKLEKEGMDAYEARTWKEKGHFDGDGYLFIPPMAFKQALDASAKYLSIQIPGKGKSTYTKHFRSGVLCLKGPKLPVTRENIDGEWFSCNSDGVRGSGKRVDRCFPVVPRWEAEVEFTILDDTITESVFEEVLTNSGQFIGIGRFRPENGGFYGRFDVVDVQWT